MSLAHIANHLASQGRGEDTHLVHMTGKELAAMQQLAEKHGGSLTINPSTGLPEAGFLSSILPMALGAAATAFLGPEMLPLVAGGIGLADYAMTGSLTQGLMAGLGAWGGGSLTGALDVAGGQALADQGADLGTKAFETSQAAALQAPESLPSSTSGLSPQEMFAGENAPTSAANIQATQNAITAQNFPNLTSEQLSQFQQAATQAANPADIARAAGQANATANATTMGNMGQGLQSIGSVIRANPGAAMAAATPLLMGSLTKQPYNAPVAGSNTNPFGLKSISSNFQGQFPAQPIPAYTAQYPNYATRPYVAAADGGLMSDKLNFAAGGSYPMSQQDTSRYATPSQMPIGAQQVAASYEPQTNPLTGEMTANMAKGGIAAFADGGPDYGSMAQDSQEVQKGIAMATRRPVMETPTPDVGINYDEPELARLDPTSRARKILENLSATSRVKLAKGLPQAGVLGAINTDPVMAQQQQAEEQSKQAIVQEAQGGLMGYAKGGESHLGDFSDGGRLLRGPGDGVSDSIPATIAGKQPARLATGEFVVPARIVSELGNGSTDAGAKRLYAMMDRIKAKRAKTKDIAADTKAYKFLPA